MNSDNELAKLIHKNPMFNTQRWLNCHKHVDKSKIVKTPNGSFPINSQTYAGNVYYFNPSLNPGLKARIEKDGGKVSLKNLTPYSKEELIELDRFYPGGVPFSKEGFPDFSNVAAKGKDGKPIIVNIGKLTGDSKKDRKLAESLYRKAGGIEAGGYTWHHIENSTKLMRVDAQVHQLVDHNGGISTSKKIIKKAA